MTKFPRLCPSADINSTEVDDYSSVIIMTSQQRDPKTTLPATSRLRLINLIVPETLRDNSSILCRKTLLRSCSKTIRLRTIKVYLRTIKVYLRSLYLHKQLPNMRVAVFSELGEYISLPSHGDLTSN